MSAQPPLESATADSRFWWVEETTFGEPPTDPDWNRFADPPWVQIGPGWGGTPNVESFRGQGSADIADHFRGSEEHPFSFEYLMQRFPVDSSGNVQGPEAIPIQNSGSEYYPSHSLVYRREVTSGGNFSAGFREYAVGLGARVSSVTFPGDAAESRPIMLNTEYDASYGRTHLIHQPSGSYTPEVVSTSSEDTGDLIIESEDGANPQTITLNGTTPATGSSIDGIDVIWADFEPVGDISVTDGSGTDILEDPLQGTENDDRGGYELGVPPLESGSTPSAIGTDPREFHFLGTDQTWGGSAAAPSGGSAGGVESADLTVEVPMNYEARTGSPYPAVVPTERTVTVDLPTRGAYESYKTMQREMDGYAADFVYEYPTAGSGGTPATITAKNAQITDSDDFDRDGSDAAVSVGKTLEAHGDPAVTINKP